MDINWNDYLVYIYNLVGNKIMKEKIYWLLYSYYKNLELWFRKQARICYNLASYWFDKWEEI